MEDRLGFVAVIEAGALEDKVVLLAESIREFAGPFRDAPIWAVQPRHGPIISQGSCNRLANLGVYYLLANVNNGFWSNYPIANKIYAAALVELIVSHSLHTLCFLDSDIICLQAPHDLLLPDGKDIAVKEVDYGGVGQVAREPVNPYWRMIYEACDVSDDQLWDIKPTLGTRVFRAYFNSGVVAVRPGVGAFAAWLSNLLKIGNSAKNIGILLEHRDNLYFIDQACLAGTILAMVPRGKVQILHPRYNYPLHEPDNRVPRTVRATCLEDLVLVHYHNAFKDLVRLRSFPMGNDLRSWLLRRLPLPASPINRGSKWRMSVTPPGS